MLMDSAGLTGADGVHQVNPNLFIDGGGSDLHFLPVYSPVQGLSTHLIFRRFSRLFRPVQSDHQNLNWTMLRASLAQFLQLPGKG